MNGDQEEAVETEDDDQYPPVIQIDQLDTEERYATFADTAEDLFVDTFGLSQGAVLLTLYDMLRSHEKKILNLEDHLHGHDESQTLKVRLDQLRGETSQ